MKPFHFLALCTLTSVWLTGCEPTHPIIAPVTNSIASNSRQARPAAIADSVAEVIHNLTLKNQLVATAPDGTSEQHGSLVRTSDLSIVPGKQFVVGKPYRIYADNLPFRGALYILKEIKDGVYTFN